MSGKTKTAFVTGASRGIGATIARRLAADGFFVGIGYRTGADRAEAVLAHIRAEGGDGVAVEVDVTSTESVKQAFASFTEKSGGLDVLVANAGVAHGQMAALITDEDMERLWQTNLAGALRTARAAIRPMLRGGAGRIVFLGSVVGLSGNAGQALYAATKAGLVGAAKSLARELAPRGILVNVVAPGLIRDG
ncbi:MAG: SDR family NAD(P)-dependent oxidoreductase [Deltaproteobacteria bacterium]|nr:SDR family NAD(P)-dependent oxidoreductase [Deltaproteobacteria bacterium]